MLTLPLTSDGSHGDTGWVVGAFPTDAFATAIMYHYNGRTWIDGSAFEHAVAKL